MWRVLEERIVSSLKTPVYCLVNFTSWRKCFTLECHCQEGEQGPRGNLLIQNDTKMCWLFSPCQHADRQPTFLVLWTTSCRWTSTRRNNLPSATNMAFSENCVRNNVGLSVSIHAWNQTESIPIFTYFFHMFTLIWRPLLPNMADKRYLTRSSWPGL